jgi:hypothetical protein
MRDDKPGDEGLSPMLGIEDFEAIPCGLTFPPPRYPTLDGLGHVSACGKIPFAHDASPISEGWGCARFRDAANAKPAKAAEVPF